MTRSEAAILLGLAAARDRRTVGKADVLAWAEDLSDIELGEAQEALRRHFRQSTEWLMPAHIRQHVRAVREEHRRHTAAALALPSRFEDDGTRAARIRNGVRRCRAAIVRSRESP